MKFKGTKGEWKILEYDNDLEVVSGEDPVICSLPDKNSEYKANAKLISCAPEMLEALKEMIAFAEFHGYTSSTEINNARSILKKATTI